MLFNLEFPSAISFLFMKQEKYNYIVYEIDVGSITNVKGSNLQ